MWYDFKVGCEQDEKCLGWTGTELGELLYTDDAAVITDSAARASKVLHVIEANVVHDGRKLSRSRCEAVVGGEPEAAIRFKGGTGMAQPSAVKYLGSSVYASGDVRELLGRRLGGAACTWQKLGFMLRWKSMKDDMAITSKMASVL